VGISRESILISSPPCSLLGIQWNHSIGESRSRTEESGSEALPKGAYKCHGGMLLINMKEPTRLQTVTRKKNLTRM